MAQDPVGLVGQRHVLPAVGASVARHGLAAKEELASVELRHRPSAISVAQFFKGEHEASSIERPEHDASEDRGERRASVLAGGTPCKQIANRGANRVFIDALRSKRFGERAFLGRGARCQPADRIQSVRSQ